MANWVIDENIFEIASNPADSRFQSAMYFTETIYRFHKLVLDHEGILISKYRKFFDNSKLINSWFKKMVRSAGHIEHRSSKLSNRISSDLDNLKFDPDDKCFVGVALNADRVITSEDGDFYKEEVCLYFITQLLLEVLKIEESISKESTKR